MTGTVLILGASGFIGGHAAAAFARAGWRVRAGARRPGPAARLAPAHEWVSARFEDLTTPQAWGPLLDGVDAVVNCVGVLQDGPGDSNRVAHVNGPRALIAACEAQGGVRFVQVSAAGADDAAGTLYARTKAEAERLVEASRLDWIILRPSLVMARASYGGTGTMRGLAGMPGFIPVLGGDQTFRPVAMADVCDAIVKAAEPGAPSGLVLDVTGPEVVSQAEVLKGLRGWLGFTPAPVVNIPGWLGWPAIIAGDIAGWLGWPSSLRSTAVKQLAYGAAGGSSEALTKALGVRPRSFYRILSDDAASLADRWHARLFFVRPLSIIALGLFWLVTGMVTLGPGFEAAKQHLITAGFSETPSWHGAFWGGWFDIVMGLALFVRPWTRTVAIGMVLATLGYLAGATIWAPQLWLDPLGPWVKVIPMMALCLFIAATDERR